MTRALKRAMKKKKTQRNQQPMIRALVWYKEEDWDVLMNMFPDRDLMPVSYGDWLARADELMEKVQAEGDIALKVFIDPLTFPQWCREKGLEMDAAARTELAMEVATKQRQQ